MPKQLVEFPLEDGSTVVFETDEVATAGNGVQRVSRGRSTGGEDNNESGVSRAAQTFDQVSQRIRPAAQMVLDSLREMNTPKEIQLEFGLKFSAKTGVIVASADSEVNFKVSVKWVNEDANPQS